MLNWGKMFKHYGLVWPSKKESKRLISAIRPGGISRVGTRSVEAGEHQKPLKGGEEKQSAASGLYDCGGRGREEEKRLDPP